MVLIMSLKETMSKFDAKSVLAGEAMCILENLKHLDFDMAHEMVKKAAARYNTLKMQNSKNMQNNRNNTTFFKMDSNDIPYSEKACKEYISSLNYSSEFDNYNDFKMKYDRMAGY
jgi:hypothetical protein